MSAKILIVDDESSARQTLDNLLFPEGYELQFASNGQDGIAQAHAWLPDAILSDVMMPGMDGFEFCRRVRAEADLGQVPIILITALDDRQAKLNGLQAGADDFIAKPIDALELRARLRTITRLDRFRKLNDERLRLEETHRELLQAHAALRASEERFRSFIEQSADGFMLTDEQGVIIEWNQAITQITGLAREKALGVAIWELQARLAAPEQQPALEWSISAMREILQSGQHPLIGQANDSEIQTTTGEKKFIQVTAFPIHTAQGYRLGAVIQDITGRKRMAEALEAESVRRRILFEESPDGILVINPQTAGFVEFNTIAHTQLGYTREEFAKLHIFDVEAQESAHETRTHIEKVLQNSKSDFETLHRTKQGEIRNVLVSAQIVKIVGQPVYYCTWRDITERKQAEERLRTSEETLRTVFDNSPIALEVYDKHGILRRCNKKVSEMFGTDANAQVGVFNLKNDPNYQGQGVWEQLLRGQEVQHEIEFDYGKVPYVSTKTGTAHYFIITTPISEQISSEIGYIVQIVDITERKQAEEKLRESEERFRSLFESSNAIMLLIEPDSGQIVAANHAAANFYGYSRAQLASMNIADINQLPQEEVAAERQRAKQEQRNYFIFPHRLADGQVRIVEVRSHPITSNRQVLLFSIIYDVTENMQNQQRLHDSQMRMEMALKGANAATWDWNVQTGETVFNERWAEIVGYSLHELEPISIQTWANLCHPDDLKVSDELLEKHFARKTEYYECEARMKHKNGAWVWVIDRGKVMEWDPEGRPLRMFGTHLDITERKQAESELLERQKLLEKVIKLGKNIAAITDLDSCLWNIYQGVRSGLGFERVNLFLYEASLRQVLGVYGTSRTGETLPPGFFDGLIDEGPGWEKALQNPSGAFFIESFQESYHPPEDHPMHGVGQHVIVAAWSGEKPVALITVDNLLSGKAITPVDLEALQLFVGYVGLAIDNASLHTDLEMKVEERTAEVQDLYDNAPAGYHSLDKDSNFIQINQTELRWLGYTREEVLGHSLLDFVTALGRDVFARNFPLLKQQGQLNNLEIEFVRKDGSTFPALVNAATITDSAGAFVMSRSTVFDNTEHKRAEEALRKSEAQLRISRDKLSAANAALEKAARLKDEFLASMSHELRTPLTGILGLSEALQLNTYGSLTEKQGKALKNIEESGRHLLALINDILDLSKIEAGMLELVIEPVPLAEICQASLQLTKGMANKKRLSVAFSMVPPSVQIRGDARRLKQMLVNLLSNAIKFTPEEGAVGLEVRADSAERVVRMTVWDTGIGIAPENLERLFQPFVQLESNLARQYEGTGLGLSLVQRMAELHGGSIKVESAPGVGSRFTILLPWSHQDTQQLAISSQEPRFMHKALVVDDSEIDTGQLKRYLHILGLETVVHKVGQGAVEVAAREKPGVILLDLRLPDQYGFEVLVELKTNPATREIPVVICSVEERRSQALAKGAAGYLVKPPTITDLRNELSRVAAESPRNQAPLAAPAASSPAVLVVDDNEVIIETLSDFLTSQNFRVTAARSGVEMLDVVSDLRPDIILIDIQMPVMDGLEATRRIRAHSDPLIAQVPIIALTALAMTGDRERCLEAGANDYMSKPIHLKELLDTLHRTLPNP